MRPRRPRRQVPLSRAPGIDDKMHRMSDLPNWLTAGATIITAATSIVTAIIAALIYWKGPRPQAPMIEPRVSGGPRGLYQVDLEIHNRAFGALWARQIRTDEPKVFLARCEGNTIRDALEGTSSKLHEIDANMEIASSAKGTCRFSLRSEADLDRVTVTMVTCPMADPTNTATHRMNLHLPKRTG
jgi:hypothetical protein